MEFLGASYTLPLTEDAIQIMEVSVMITKKWCHLSCAEAWKIVCPAKLQANPQPFYQELIKQLSLLFDRRNVPSTDVP
jgi:hypothetical protein